MIWNNARLYDYDPTSRLFFQFIDHNITRMVILRCTQKLLARMRVVPVDVADASATCLGDWTANLLRLGHRQVILCVSQHALLPVLLPAKGVADLPTHLPDAVANILDPIGIAPSHIAQEIGQMQRVMIARTNNRQVLGVMNDMVQTLWFDFQRFPQAPLEEHAMRLAEMIYGPLKYQSPAQTAHALFTKS